MQAQVVELASKPSLRPPHIPLHLQGHRPCCHPSLSARADASGTGSTVHPLLSARDDLSGSLVLIWSSCLHHQPPAGNGLVITLVWVITYPYQGVVGRCSVLRGNWPLADSYSTGSGNGFLFHVLDPRKPLPWTL